MSHDLCINLEKRNLQHLDAFIVSIYTLYCIITICHHIIVQPCPECPTRFYININMWLSLFSLVFNSSLDSQPWKDFLAKPSLPFVLRLLSGLCKGHAKTQVNAPMANVQSSSILDALWCFTSKSRRYALFSCNYFYRNNFCFFLCVYFFWYSGGHHVSVVTSSMKSSQMFWV